MIEVVIPAYNAGPFLAATLHSVAAQTQPPARVSVVDDASSDDTVAVARACAAELAGRVDIRVIANAGPRGPSAARNTAIRRSEAPWIALLDADDLLTPGHHEALLATVRAAGAAVLGFGDSTVFAERGGAPSVLVSSFLAKSGVLSLPARELAPDCWTADDDLFAALLRRGVFATSACLFRREAALGAGLFDETMAASEDTDFFLRLALCGRFVFTRALVANKRVHDANPSHPSRKMAFEMGTAFSLAKLARQGAPDAARAAAIETALRVAIDGYLYHASLAGLGAYCSAAALARRAGRLRQAAHPRHLARLLLRRWLGGEA